MEESKAPKEEDKNEQKKEEDKNEPEKDSAYVIQNPPERKNIPVEQSMSDKSFAIGMVGLVIIMIPFFWYTHSIYVWSHEHAGDYKQPKYTQIWMTFMGAITWAFFKEVLGLGTWYIFSKVI